MENPADTQIMNYETTENNKLIAEFMGLNKIAENNGIVFKDNNTNEFHQIKYHSDWNWLMSVVEKIEKIQIGGYIDFHIMPDAVIVRDQIDETKPLIIINKSEGKGSIETHSVMFETKIQAVYTAVILFIKWYIAQIHQ